MEKEIFERYEQLEGELLDGRYRLEKLIGIGGMAVVYKATDKMLGRNVRKDFSF